jgi:hypothetical protein
MRLAAQEFTKDPFTVEISKSDDLPKIATAIFRMKNEVQYKVVDQEALTFKRLIPFYNHIAIWFEQEKPTTFGTARPSSNKNEAKPNKTLDQTPRKSRFFVKAWCFTQLYGGAGQLCLGTVFYEISE